jgi:hypothetical protein
MKAPRFSCYCRLSELNDRARAVAARHQAAETAFLASLAALLLTLACLH